MQKIPRATAKGLQLFARSLILINREASKALEVAARLLRLVVRDELSDKPQSEDEKKPKNLKLEGFVVCRTTWQKILKISCLETVFYRQTFDVDLK